MTTRYILVPFAGEKFSDQERGITALELVDRVPLFVQALKRRPWASENDSYIFVLRAVDHIDVFLRFMRENFPRAQLIVLPQATSGCLMNVLSGLGCVTEYKAPIAVDFADTIFASADTDPFELLRSDKKAAGVIPYRVEPSPGHGDLQIEDGVVQWASEGKAISPYLSVGVFIFRNLRSLLKAAALSSYRQPRLSRKDSLSVCDSFNTLMSEHARVLGCEVSDIRIAGRTQPSATATHFHLRSLYPPDVQHKTALHSKIPAGQLLSGVAEQDDGEGVRRINAA